MIQKKNLIRQGLGSSFILEKDLTDSKKILEPTPEDITLKDIFTLVDYQYDTFLNPDESKEFVQYLKDFESEGKFVLKEFIE